MKPVSRRKFLGTAVLAPLAFHTRLTRFALASQIRDRVLLIDARERCTLPESLAGFARGLEASSIPYRRVTLDSIEPAGFIVMPGAVLPSSELAATLAGLARRGSTAIYESGAAYADEAAFRTEQRLLGAHFQLRVQAPLELWGGKRDGPATSPPYVHYDWPARIAVRDFSRAVPVTGAVCDPSHPEDSGEAIKIASIGNHVVACRRRLGDGHFVYLGSPLGPHLGAGDREAQALLAALLHDARSSF
jgi:hypothetical protein